jgi:3-hydroxyisobutyrate dehydrogenase-like beta-hydroxyacid dehydrogenase
MNIGVIGTGEIGAVIVRKSRNAGYPVKWQIRKGQRKCGWCAPFEESGAIRGLDGAI